MSAPPPTVPAGGLRHATGAFEAPGFRAVFAGAVLFSLGQWTERVAIGWFVFDATDSAFLTAAATAAHAAPAIFVGPIAGAVSDRAPRPGVLGGASVLKAVAVLVIAALVATEGAAIGLVLALVALSGIGATFHLSSLHTLSGDLVGPDRRASAISLVSTGQRAVAAAGALASGVVIGVAGPAWSLVLGGAAFALAALAYRAAHEPQERHGRSQASFVADTVEGLRLVSAVPMVAILLGLMVIVEIFGFSFHALLPAVADRVLHVGPLGFGGLSAMVGVGSVGGTLFLAAYADRARLGLLFLGVFTAFGALMIALGASHVYALSLVAAAGIGACAAMVDALEWIMLQNSVEDRMRGRALGAWNVAIGLGWIGPLILGALADAVSVPAAFALAGIVLLATAAGAASASPRLRRA